MSPRLPTPTLAVAALVALLAGCPAPLPSEPEQRRSVRPSLPPIERSPAQPWLATSPTPRPSGFRAPPSPNSTPDPDAIAGQASAAPCEGAGAVSTLVIDGQITKPTGAAMGKDGHLWLALYDAHALVELAPEAGCAWRVVRRLGGTSADLTDPRGLAFDVERRWLYVADYANHRIRRVDTQAEDPKIEVFAGAGIGGFADGPAASAWFDHPAGVAVDRAGAVYVADSYNHRVRRIANGAVTTLAGGTQGDGPGQFSRPAGIAVEIERVNPLVSPPPSPIPGAVEATPSFVPAVFVADTQNHRVVRIAMPRPSASPAGGTAGGGGSTSGGTTSVFGPGASEWEFTVIAGEAGQKALVDGPAGESRLADPTTLLFDAGALWVGDTGNHAVRRIGGPLAAKPTIMTFAGGGTATLDGPLLEASFRFPQGLARGLAGELYVADTDGDRVRVARGIQEAP